MLRAVALRFALGAMTARSMPGTSRRARRRAFRPEAWIPSSFVRRTFMRARIRIVRWAVALAPLTLLLAAPGAGAVSLKRVGQFAQPVYVTAPAGNRHDVYVVERRGVVRLVRDG